MKKKRQKDGMVSRVRDARTLFRQGVARFLGMRVVSLTPRKVVARMHVRPVHLNRTGRVNGGVLMAFADVLGAAGSVANRPLGRRGGTIESKTNFFASALGPVLTGICVPLHIGRTTSVWQTTIRNRDGRIAAIVTQTQIQIPPSQGGNND